MTDVHNPTPNSAADQAKEGARVAGESLKEGARKVAADTREAFDGLAEGVGKMKDGAAEFAQDTARAVRAKGEHAYEAVREKGADVYEAVREKGEAYARKAHDGAQRLRVASEECCDEMADKVRRHPVQALGIAAGLGFLVGLVLAQGGRPHHIRARHY